MNRTVVTILLLVFASFALTSTVILYYTHQLPIEKKLTTTLYAYESYGAFDYVVTLKPNTVYNKTTLEPGEGPIFTKIADTLYVDFTYTFQGNKPANLTVNYDFLENLETTMVQRQIETAPPKTVYTTGTTANLHLTDIPPINISSVEDLVDTISKETAMTIITYNGHNKQRNSNDHNHVQRNDNGTNEHRSKHCRRRNQRIVCSTTNYEI